MNKVLVLILILGFGLFGCKKHQLNDCVSSIGDIEKHKRLFEDFNRLTISDQFDLNLIQDTQNFVIIETGKNLMPGIKTETSNNGLYIENENTCNFMRKFDHRIKLELHFKNLEEINLFADVSVTSNTITSDNLSLYSEAVNDLYLNLDCNEIFVETINSTYLNLTGKVNTFKGQIHDISDLDARNLIAKELLVDFHSPLDCYINATDLIFVNLTNRGDVYYVKEPSKNKILNSRKGEGNLILLQ